MHYYLARDLARRLDINLAKWKRWSREFLPPDPLGGLQSGFARQYSFKDAYHVALGGFLVGDLKFSITEAGRILKDLGPWLKRSGYLRTRANGGMEGASAHPPYDLLFIRPPSPTGGSYLYWCCALGTKDQGRGTGLGHTLDELDFFSVPEVRLVNLGAFSEAFHNKIK